MSEGKNDRDVLVRCDTLFTPYERLESASILIRDGRVVSVSPGESGDPGRDVTVIHEPGRTVAPGYIDLHIHGARGCDVMDGTLASLSEVSAALAKHGTTSYLATTLSAPDGDTETAVRGFAQNRGKVLDGAEPIGLHLEGPFLNPLRRGTHNPSYLAPADVAKFRRWVELSGDTVRKITVAPEVEGGIELTREATKLGIQVSLGHSDATVSQTLAAVDAGALHATHTYNAMRPLHQREPGILGAVLSDDRVYAEVIADGLHVHPAAVLLLFRAKGAERTLLITDGISAVDMPDGVYPLGDKSITVRNGECRDSDGTIAGSTLTLDRAVRNLLRWSGVPFEHALASATSSPARSMRWGDRKGIVAPGNDADLVFLDDELEVTRTMVRGRTVYSRT